MHSNSSVLRAQDEGISASMSILKSRQVGVLWEELRNFRSNCVEASKKSEERENNEGDCQRDFERIEKTAKGTERWEGLLEYKGEGERGGGVEVTTEEDF